MNERRTEQRENLEQEVKDDSKLAIKSGVLSGIASVTLLVQESLPRVAQAVLMGVAAFFVFRAIGCTSRALKRTREKREREKREYAELLARVKFFTTYLNEREHLGDEYERLRNVLLDAEKEFRNTR